MSPPKMIDHSISQKLLLTDISQVQLRNYNQTESTPKMPNYEDKQRRPKKASIIGNLSVRVAHAAPNRDDSLELKVRGLNAKNSVIPDLRFL